MIEFLNFLLKKRPSTVTAKLLLIACSLLITLTIAELACISHTLSLDKSYNIV